MEVNINLWVLMTGEIHKTNSPGTVFLIISSSCPFNVPIMLKHKRKKWIQKRIPQNDLEYDTHVLILVEGGTHISPFLFDKIELTHNTCVGLAA